MAAKSIMIQGTMSNAGKSLLAAGLCRIFRQDGYSVAPFKSQNMALNSYITRDGLEMGRAQVVQAEAAGVEPTVEMNPILLKPTSDMGSQVIVNGVPLGNYKAGDYFRMKRQLVPQIMAAYRKLEEQYDIIVLEGAGSPAEINLKAEDIVNMGMARMAKAPVLLAGDIDRGGVFASLYGTIALLEPEERAMVKGTIINKFRGDVDILKPGLDMLEELTHVPVLGVVPMMDVDLDDEDSLSDQLRRTGGDAPLDVAVVRLPRISNFTDFNALGRHPAVGLRYVSNPFELGRPDLVVLPGTKSTLHDLDWLKETAWPGPSGTWRRNRCPWWASAAATRCWAAPSPTPWARRGAAAGRAWVCCPSTPSLTWKRPAPGYSVLSLRWRGPSPCWKTCRWRGTRSTWVRAAPALPPRAGCWAPISTACLTRWRS